MVLGNSNLEILSQQLTGSTPIFNHWLVRKSSFGRLESYVNVVIKHN